MDIGLTLVTNATKHSTPMPNVARLNTLLISAPVPFPFRADEADSTSSTRRVATTLFLRQERYAVGWVTDGAGSTVGREESEAYSAAIMFDFKSMPSAFATPAP
jgi:hypothetical protein